MDTSTAELAQLAYARFEIADALYRYAFDLDHGDPDSLSSAVTEDCVFDFTLAGAKLGLYFPVLNGRDALLQSLLPMLGGRSIPATRPATSRSK